MRRVPVIVLIAVLVVGVLALRGGKDPYRATAIFDTASGVAAGSVVKMAGARVGTVRSVNLTPEFGARVEFEMDAASGPLKADATCQILPESLISEKFVQCEPGTAAANLGADGPRVVGLKRTAVPVALQDVIDIFAVPTSDRLRIMLNELGLSTAARGEDLNAIVRRANPALGQANRVLKILADQRDTVVEAVTQTDQIVEDVVQDTDAVRRLVTRTADVTETTAIRREELGDTVRRLPDFLDRTRETLATLDRLAVEAAPVVRELRTAAPGLNALNTAAPPAAEAADGAVKALAAAAATGRKAIPPALPVARRLRRLTAAADRPGVQLEQLAASLRDKGAIEGLLTFFYHAASLTASYDSLSHIGTVQVSAASCLALPDGEGCDGTFGATPAPGRAKPSPKATTTPKARRAEDAGPAPVAAPPIVAPDAPFSPGPTAPAPAAPKPASPAAVSDLLDFLLGG